MRFEQGSSVRGWRELGGSKPVHLGEADFVDDVIHLCDDDGTRGQSHEHRHHGLRHPAVWIPVSCLPLIPRTSQAGPAAGAQVSACS